MMAIRRRKRIGREFTPIVNVERAVKGNR
jgi:hypothetical protein